MDFRKVMIIVYLVVFVSFFDNHSLLPIMAPYAKSLMAGIALIGIIMGIYSLVNLFGNLGAGFFIDRVGRKKPMILGLLIVSVSVFSYSLCKNPYQLLFLRGIHGFGASIIAPASLAYLGDMAKPDKRGQTMAIYGACIGLTVLIGPPLAGFVRDNLGYNYVFYLISLMMLAVAIPTHLFVKESLEKKDEVGFEKFPRLIRRGGIFVSYTSAFCLMFSLGLLIVLLPLHAQDLGFSSTQTGLLFSSFALAAIILQALPTRKISDKIGRKTPIVFGLFLISVSLFTLKYLEKLYLLYLVMFLYGVGFGFLFPAMTALIVDETEITERGTASGVFNAVYSLGVVFGTMSVGLLTKIQVLHPFQIGSIVAILGIAFALVLLRKHKATH